MNRHLRKASAEIRRWLEEIGAAEIKASQTSGDHIRIDFRFRGRSWFYFMPQTTSDRRSHYRVKQDLRHMLGLVGRSRPKAGRKRKRQKAEKPLGSPPKLTMRPDPWARLKELL